MTDPTRSPDLLGGLPPAPPCPFCAGGETELFSAFGSHASVSTYWCRRCRSPFELLKWTAEARRGETGVTDTPLDASR